MHHLSLLYNSHDLDNHNNANISENEIQIRNGNGSGSRIQCYKFSIAKIYAIHYTGFGCQKWTDKVQLCQNYGY